MSNIDEVSRTLGSLESQSKTQSKQMNKFATSQIEMGDKVTAMHTLLMDSEVLPRISKLEKSEARRNGATAAVLALAAAFMNITNIKGWLL